MPPCQMMNCYHYFRRSCCLHHHGISSPRRVTVRTSTSQMLFSEYIYICIKVFLYVLKSTEFIFTIKIGATFNRGSVTIDNIDRNHTVAARGAMHSIAESPILWWNWKIMHSNLLSYQLMWHEYGNHHQNSNWNLCRPNYGEKRNERGRHVIFLYLKNYFSPIYFLLLRIHKGCNLYC